MVFVIHNLNLLTSNPSSRYTAINFLNKEEKKLSEQGKSILVAIQRYGQSGQFEFMRVLPKPKDETARMVFPSDKPDTPIHFRCLVFRRADDLVDAGYTDKLGVVWVNHMIFGVSAPESQVAAPL